MSQRKKKLLFILLCTFVISVVILNGLYLYYNRGIGSGWVWQRISRVNYTWQQGGNAFSSEYMSRLLFEYPFMTSLSEVTGLNIVDTYYLPIIAIYPIIFIYPLVKYFHSGKIFALFLSFGIYLLMFAKTQIFINYSVGMILLFIYILMLLKYIKSKDNRLLISSFILLIPMKFLSPHMEIWSISFLLMMTIAFVVLNRLNYDVKGIDLERILYGLKTYAVLGVVFLLSWQPKGEDFLYHVYTGIYDLDMLLYFRRYIFGISESGTDIVLIHGYSPRSPFVISQINIILHLILIISIGISMIWWAIKFLKVKQYEFEIKDIGICLLIFAPVPHGIMKLAINQPVYLLNIIRLFGPILVFYTFIRIWQDNPRNYQGYFAIGYKDIKKNIPYIVIIMVVFLIFSHYILYVNHDIGHRYGNDDIRSNTATWIVDYQDSPTRVFTDWRTINRLRYSLSEENRNISELRDIRYRDHRYSYVIGMENESVADQFDFFVIDFHNIDKPLCAGGGYQDFKPLIYHYESIETNTNINKVYDAGHYEVFNNRY